MLPYPTIAYVLQIGTYSALIGDQALFCSSKISKALPSVFSYSTLHFPLLSTHCNIHVCWGLTAGTACPLHQPLTARRMLSDLVKAGPRLCSPSLHNQHKSARHGCVLTTDQALCLVAHYDDYTSNRAPATCLIDTSLSWVVIARLIYM